MHISGLEAVLLVCLDATLGLSGLLLKELLHLRRRRKCATPPQSAPSEASDIGARLIGGVLELCTEDYSSESNAPPYAIIVMVKGIGRVKIIMGERAWDQLTDSIMESLAAGDIPDV